MSNPIIIQGGMGVAVSNWNLARTVSQLGQVGVVSSALIAVIFAGRLQEGDFAGAMRRALAHFPFPEVAERVIETYYLPNGKVEGIPFKPCAMPAIKSGPALVDLMVAANFAEVFLAKEGHSGVVGINLLEKLQTATLPSLYGAMLAGVDYVLMGAGIPRAIPGILDRYARGEAAQMRIDVEGAQAGEEFLAEFDPIASFGAAAPKELKRPQFFPIVSSSTLATSLARKSSGRVDGFIIEADTAGGHNAPPRGPLTLSAEGEPIYGPRDVADLAAFRALGLPFYLAGCRAHPAQLTEALAQGAAGIQVGTAFAFCEESGMALDVRREAVRMAKAGTAKIFTDPLASPTGFPFKVLQMKNTLSEEATYLQRNRICDLGYLRTAYKKEDGKVGYRCSAEPIEDYVAKGGKIEDTKGRKCLCNGLAANVGYGQVRPDSANEGYLITAGNDLVNLAAYLPQDSDTYSAADVVKYLTSTLPA